MDVTNNTTAILILSVILGTGTAFANNKEECHEAKDTYGSAIDDVETALKRYADCVQSSQGHDDCESEFRRLKSAQEDFESAVNEIEDECS